MRGSGFLRRPGFLQYNQLTLKRRIFIIFLLSTIIPFFVIILISYYSIYSLISNKIHTGIQSNLKQVQQSLENTINNLNHVSQQLAFGGEVGKKLAALLETDEGQAYQRSRLTDELKNELSLVTFTNPSIGLTLYYYGRDGTYNFENSAVKEHFVPDQSPLLAQYYGISYYGPHISNNRFDNQHVLSVLRKVDLPNRDDVYVYIETGFHLTQNILDNSSVGHVSHLMVDNNGVITYSEVPDRFPKDTRFRSYQQAGSSGADNGYQWFREKSNQGWSLISVIPTSEYNMERTRWIRQIALFSSFFLIVSVVLAWMLWNMVYRPLNNFNVEIKLMSQNRTRNTQAVTNIPEFDYLLNQFRQMKEQIWQLFAEVEQKEKRRIDLEVEKLRYQINPHFLMNTLDTVHWLAVMNGQKEIDRLVLSLNKLLFYNLGKLGEISTIREELDALQQYLILQQIRYDFQFDVRLDVDEEVLNEPIPRFILQPLVENSLYHGLTDDGYIQVSVRQHPLHGVEIIIADNGSGMDEETIRRLLNNKEPQNRKVGLGIGLNYVKRTIEARYGEKAELQVQSAPGEGTRIILHIPYIRQGEDHS